MKTYKQLITEDKLDDLLKKADDLSKAGKWKEARKIRNQVEDMPGGSDKLYPLLAKKKAKTLGNDDRELSDLLKVLGFNSVTDFKKYMLLHAKSGEYGGKNYTEKRKGYELNYSDNSDGVFGIGANVRGIFVNNRFN